MQHPKQAQSCQHTFASSQQPAALLSAIIPFALMQVRDSLTARAKEFNIMVDDIAITHLSFGTEVGTPLLTARFV